MVPSRSWRAAFFAAALASVAPASAAFAQDLGSSIKVVRLGFDVTLSDGNTYRMAGRLYHHGSFRERPFQVLVHGATHNHRYWDFPDVNGR